MCKDHQNWRKKGIVIRWQRSSCADVSLVLAAFWFSLFLTVNVSSRLLRQKVKIDKNSLEKEIEKVFKEGEKNYLLSEIVFEEKMT